MSISLCNAAIFKINKIIIKIAHVTLTYNATSDPANLTVPPRTDSQPNQTPCSTTPPPPTYTELHEQRGQSLWTVG